MAFKAFLLLLVTTLFVATRASSSHEELKIKAAYVQTKAPPPLPTIKAPSPPPLVTKPPIYVSPPKVIKTPPTPPLPKPPTYTPPPKVIKAPPTPTLPKPPVKPPTYAPPLPPVKSKKDCVPLCEKRCILHSRKRTCNRACMTCCDRCRCVPPGTSGNRERCGKCYTNMVTHGNRPKCP